MFELRSLKIDLLQYFLVLLLRIRQSMQQVFLSITFLILLEILAALQKVVTALEEPVVPPAANLVVKDEQANIVALTVLEI